MIKILKMLTKKEVGIILICTIFIFGQVWLEFRLIDYVKEIFSLLNSGTNSINEILLMGCYMLLCALGSVLSAVLVSFFASRIASSLAMRIRLFVFEKVMSFSSEEINNFSTSSLINRSTNDITQVQRIFAMGMQFIIKAPILAIWAIIVISGKNWQWTITTGAAVFILLSMLSVIVFFALPKFKKIQTYTDDLNKVTRENLIGLRVVRAYNAEVYQNDKFQKSNLTLTNTNLFTNRIMAIIGPTMGLIMSGIGLAVYWIGAYLINNTEIIQDKFSLFGDMVIFSNYSMQVIMAFMMLTMIFIMLPRASVSAKRIMEVLMTVAKINDGNISQTEIGEGEIEFKNVSFKYNDSEEYVLKDINFKATKGETIAIIGATGSGKTSLINLIPRLYDVSDGSVLIDGINVKDYKQETLHNKIGYVLQKAVLFSGTVSSNVAYGNSGLNKSSINDVKDAIRIAQGTEFVEKMIDKYDSQISQGGANLSGGQKQRLSIARAINKKPEIYIFDDSFSALDYKTDMQLRQALKKETSNITTVIVAQRIGTIKDADKIIVLDDGKIVSIGTHKELLKDCEIYKEIALSQLSEEELSYE